MEETPYIMNAPLPNVGNTFFQAHKTRGFLCQMEIVFSVSVTSNP
jgi:hypothetical protein